MLLHFLTSLVGNSFWFVLVWNKIKEKVKSLGDKVKARTKELIEKYKPKILNTIDRVKQFIIDEGQKLIIELKGDLVEVILEKTGTKVEKRSITDCKFLIHFTSFVTKNLLNFTSFVTNCSKSKL